ncbi:unnamed protein product [Phytophthora fragariaefolia]|uniref:Unnamed protein product n=1 Tax=Phytophthora fragariaefolia TaxID=1490495 RepID=A0A9W6TRM2_9STRA|nr:unnamed protein product [Phytophthora fragariaefolia]
MMTVDTRAVNALTEPMPWPMPDIEADLAQVEDSDAYFTIDWWRGYWQLPQDEDSLELYTIMTHRGMFTPTRVSMGSGQILAWLDDILGYARSPSALLVVLKNVLELCAEYGLKLHPLKCCFFTREATWCGRMMSAQGVCHCPSRIDGLVSLPAPHTAGKLQQFLCAVNWMRGNIPEYNALTAKLYEVLGAAASVAQSRKKTRLHRVLLDSVGWGLEHDTALANVKDAVLRMVTLAHPKDDWEVCLFADASQIHFGAVVSQIPPEDAGLPIEKQRHQPLAFLTPQTRASLCLQAELVVIIDAAHVGLIILDHPGTGDLRLNDSLLPASDSIHLHASTRTQEVYGTVIPPAQHRHRGDLQRLHHRECPAVNVAGPLLPLVDDALAQAKPVCHHGANGVEAHAEHPHRQSHRRVVAVGHDQAHVCRGGGRRVGAEYSPQIADDRDCTRPDVDSVVRLCLAQIYFKPALDMIRQQHVRSTITKLRHKKGGVPKGMPPTHRIQ